MKPAFLAGYRECGANLPNDWEQIAKVLDIAAMATFLSSKPNGELPKSAKTAISIIEKTAKFLGY